VDVRDSLHSCRIGGQVIWNGINEVLRRTHPGVLARVKHETFGRSDALLVADGVIPKAFQGHDLSLGSYTLESQFSRAIFDVKPDAFVLSIQTDLTTSNLVRHNTDGFLFYPSENTSWGEADRAWLKSDFTSVGTLDAKKSMHYFAAIIERIRKVSEAPILIYNLSAVTPGEMLHCHQGLDESFSTRIRRFNLGLIELSEATGISVVDVDSVLARHGTDKLKLDTFHLTADAYRLIAEEVVRVLADLGTLEETA
jgi:hypothetical protein